MTWLKKNNLVEHSITRNLAIMKSTIDVFLKKFWEICDSVILILYGFATRTLEGSPSMVKLQAV